MSDTFIGVDEIRDHARRSALAGRGIWCNPHLGVDAVVWADAYRAVPAEQHGSQPQLLTSFRTIHARARKKAKRDDGGWHAFKLPSKKELVRALHYER